MEVEAGDAAVAVIAGAVRVSLGPVAVSWRASCGGSSIHGGGRCRNRSIPSVFCRGRFVQGFVCLAKIVSIMLLRVSFPEVFM